MSVSAVESLLASVLLGVLGLCLGSFLNVVIHRLPIMRQLRAQRYRAYVDLALHGKTGEALPQMLEPFNLATPRSRCPHCGTPVAARQNIPVLSWLLLKGRCAHCAAPISVRYVLIEALVGAGFASLGWLYGLSLTALAWGVLLCALLAVGLIFREHRYAPVAITVPTAVLGLAFALSGHNEIASEEAVFFALIGTALYGGLKLAMLARSKREVLGRGLSATSAMLGAWLGIWSLPLFFWGFYYFGFCLGNGDNANPSTQHNGA